MSQEQMDLGSCPVCGKAVEIPKIRIKIQYFSITCSCGKLLLYDEGKLYDLHRKLHEEDPEWPENGKGIDNGRLGR